MKSKKETFENTKVKINGANSKNKKIASLKREGYLKQCQ
jgi:hypothetical protein